MPGVIKIRPRFTEYISCDAADYGLLYHNYAPIVSGSLFGSNPYFSLRVSTVMMYFSWAKSTVVPSSTSFCHAVHLAYFYYRCQH